MKKTAFSLVELLVTLIIVSLVMSALAPVITKKLKSQGITIGMVGTVTQEKETFDCSGENFMRVGDLCVTRKNMGDSSTLTIPITITKIDISKGETCPSGGYCCWQGETANQSACTSSNGDYSGCNRTVCNFSAAEIICKNFNYGGGVWRLPTLDEMANWGENSISKNNDGLMLCDYSSSTKGSAQCRFNNGGCKGAYDNHCDPHDVWSGDVSGDSAGFYKLDDGSWFVHPDGAIDKSYAFSTRCVVDMKTIATKPEEEEEKLEIKYETRAPQSQADCDPYNAHYFEGTCITKFNAGDENGPEIGDVGASTIEGVDILSVGTKCTSNVCCWKGKTSSSSSTFFNSSYSGEARTVCTWGAADLACKNHDVVGKIGDEDLPTQKGLWRLPTYAELQAWQTATKNDVSSSIATLTRFLGKDGLDLCTHNSDSDPATYYGTARCCPLQKCPTAARSDAYCDPYQVWGEEASIANGYRYTLNSSGVSLNTTAKTKIAFSTRCVLDKVYAKEMSNETEETKDYTGWDVPTSQEECDQYDAHYFNGTCITKANTGDIANGGPPLNSTGTTPSVGTLTDYGIQILPPGTRCTTNVCCWRASNTVGNCASYTPTKEEYSACQRTMCTWYAAKLACEKYDINGTKGLWELPENSDFTNWKTSHTTDVSYSTSKLYRYLGSEGINLCQYVDSSAVASSGMPWCTPLQKCATAANSAGYCDAYRVWGKALDSTPTTVTSYSYQINSSGPGINSSWNKNHGGASGRCVLKLVQKLPEIIQESDSRELTPPKSQADCDKYNAFYFQEEGATEGICITRANAGDTSNGGAPLASTTANTGNFTDYGIYLATPGTRCTNNTCCWIGQTASSCATYGDSVYSGCNRTVCTWDAADIACKNYNPKGNTKGLWELPTVADLTKWKNVLGAETADNASLSRYLGSKGLDLCDSASNSSSTKCVQQAKCATASKSDAYCDVYKIWGEPTDVSETVTTAYALGLKNNAVGVSSHGKYSFGIGARCVLRNMPTN